MQFQSFIDVLLPQNDTSPFPLGVHDQPQTTEDNKLSMQFQSFIGQHNVINMHVLYAVKDIQILSQIDLSFRKHWVFSAPFEDIFL